MCWVLWQDVGVDARAGGAGVEAECVPRAGGQGGAGQARARAFARPAAAAARQAQVEDVHERRERPVRRHTSLNNRYLYTPPTNKRNFPALGKYEENYRYHTAANHMHSSVQRFSIFLNI